MELKYFFERIVAGMNPGLEGCVGMVVNRQEYTTRLCGNKIRPVDESRAGL